MSSHSQTVKPGLLPSPPPPTQAPGKQHPPPTVQEHLLLGSPSLSLTMKSSSELSPAALRLRARPVALGLRCPGFARPGCGFALAGFGGFLGRGLSSASHSSSSLSGRLRFFGAAPLAADRAPDGFAPPPPELLWEAFFGALLFASALERDLSFGALLRSGPSAWGRIQ